MNSRNTDLEQVKLVAHALLNVAIHPTEFSSVVASHPFTNTVIIRKEPVPQWDRLFSSKRILCRVAFAWP